ncbi:hypothetical protein D3C80_1301620 [compost metagenome]
MFLLAYRFINCPSRVVKEVMIDSFTIDTAYPERDFTCDLIHKIRQFRLYVFYKQIGSNRFITASNIITNAGRRNLSVNVGCIVLIQQLFSILPLALSGTNRPVADPDLHQQAACLVLSARNTLFLLPKNH